MKVTWQKSELKVGEADDSRRAVTFCDKIEINIGGGVYDERQIVYEHQE